jgi:hypothetical protein
MTKPAIEPIAKHVIALLPPRGAATAGSVRHLRAPPLRRSLLLPVPAAARGSWARLFVQVEGAEDGLLAFASAGAEAEATGFPRFELLEQRTGLAASRRRFAATRFLPHGATQITIDLFGTKPLDGAEAHATLQALPRWKAALVLLRDRQGGVPALLRSLRGHPVGSWPAALRRGLARWQIPHRSEASEYAIWVRLFDQWTPRDFPAPGKPSIGVLVFAPPGTEGDVLAQTTASLDAQYMRARDVVVVAPGPDRPRLPAGRYVAILQAGEVLPPWALALAARELAARGTPELAIADEDRLTDDGRREAPVFKPEPNRLLMLSGTLASGLWLLRRDILEKQGLPATPWAEVARLELWLHLYEASGVTGLRLPFILSHRRPDAPAAPHAEVARPVDAHLRRVGSQLGIDDGDRRLLRLRAGAPSPSVDILIPSSLRHRHAVACISEILRGTDYPGMSVRVGIGQARPLGPEQREAAATLEALGARVLPLQMTSFNFSAVINRLAALGSSEYVLLLNDDVTPMAADWLSWMVACMDDRRIAGAGARLLYPGGTVQHGGVLMGLGGLCEHAHRGLDGNDPGYAGRAVLTQELSAVTAACMLVRRRQFEDLDGLDESYPSAFNDVDFCLRLRKAGFGIAYVAQAELTHHELQTYGSHYRGERAPFEAEETARMRRCWADIIAADPYHNPNLRLDEGLEWRPAFPPRRPVGTG